jgi:hyperosmotically inducible periplasmic protein
VRDLLRIRVMKLISLKMGLAFGALALAACANDKPASNASNASSLTTTTSAPTSTDANESVASTSSSSSDTSSANATTPTNGSTATTDTSIPQTRAHGNDSHAQTWGGSTTPQTGDGNAAGASQPPATTAPPPPNAAQNQNGGSNLTPIDQGNNASDLKITQQIRKQVVSDSSLSFTAKNVKIITVNGRVTLKGQVNSDNEKKWIEATADKVVGNANVDNQITVKQ